MTPNGLFLVWLKAQPLTDTHATIVGKGVTWLTEIQEQIHIADLQLKQGTCARMLVMVIRVVTMLLLYSEERCGVELIRQRDVSG